MPPFRCIYSSLNEVPNASAPQKEHKQMMLVAKSKEAISKAVQKGREAKRDRDKTRSLKKV